MKELVVMDIEIYPNYALVGFKKLDGKVLQVSTTTRFDTIQKERIINTMKKYTSITFNGLRYDMPMLCKMLDGATTKELFEMSKCIVSENLPAWKAYQDFGVETKPIKFDHIDISEPAPAVFVSLKAYGVRLYSPKLQDLPYPFDTYLTPAEMVEVAKYNINDLNTTIDLYNAIKERIDLRVEMGKQYNQDLRSKSDAQIAEAVLINELAKKGVVAEKAEVPKEVSYKAPKHIVFNNPTLQTLLKRVQEAPFKINPANGSPELPDWLKKYPITIGGTSYTVGLGGLHSKEKKMVVIPDETQVLRNCDVASYYPSMMIEYGFYPKRLTLKFLDVYKKIYRTRLKAKAKVSELKGVEGAEGELLRYITISDGNKLSLNASFGKLGSRYSKLYAPDLLLQITITGQLMLLMLIEQFEEVGIAVKSANTDGVELLCPKGKEPLLEAIVFDWEMTTGMVMEHGHYNALYSRDVNNYIAVYDGYTKAKGAYAEPSLSKNSEYPIVFQAVRKYLLDGTPMEQTIKECTDIKQFLTGRTVNGGAVWRGQYLGKVVRWFYSTDGDSIHYKTNNNKVPKSDGAEPLMNLVDNLERLDYDKYFKLAEGHLTDLGVKYNVI
jgi:DNA polymerase elongation subunit (family B)